MEENRLNTKQIRLNIDKEIKEDKLIEKMNNQFLGKENCEKKQDINTNFDDTEKSVEIFVKQCEEALKGKELFLERLRNLGTDEGRDHFKTLLNYKSQKADVPQKYINIGQEKIDSDKEPTIEDLDFIVKQASTLKRAPSPEKRKEIIEKIKAFATEEGKKTFDKYVNYQTGDNCNDDDCSELKNSPAKEKEANKYEYVNHPSHYNNYSVEVIEMMLRIYGPQKVYDFCEMNAFKYRMRMGTKHGIDISQDLDKERWYLKKAKEIKEQFLS